MNTARRLKESLEDISLYLADGLQIRYLRIDTIDDLKTGMTQVLDEIRSVRLTPWIHLEGHGLSDENGFQLGNGTSCTWAQLKEIITPINIEMGLNLFLILATCYGGSFARAIETTNRAPVVALIGPKRSIKVRDIEKAFPIFYRTFFESLSLKKALQALNVNSPKDIYYQTTAEQFFYDVWASYKEKQCTEREIEKRARKMYQEAKSQKLTRTPSVGQFKRMIHSIGTRSV